MEAKLLQLERQVQKLTPQNSSLPPSKQHPHARLEKPKRKSGKRRAALFLEDLLNVPCCAATTVKMQGRVSVALAGTYVELREELESQSQLSMDETPTKQGQQKAWLWVAVAKSLAVFAIFNSRKATVSRFSEGGCTRMGVGR